MSIDRPELESLKYNPAGNNSPNEKAVIISGIDGLADQISEMMDKLCDGAGDSKQQIAISKAWNKITQWQTHELKELKQAFALIA
jgi:hypothetical protein